ncbi:hybrid sensor histidine kinase/response regulator [Leptolyngbya ohadii]|uniref:hybrid sensor histidine kinase/response regulator n=1 Tax=Leptolyngbya ohadii TaxID=1962290 RepID=UPI000B59FCB0|nr:ATP-binding protein [Leptolyngbya ohadii]
MQQSQDDPEQVISFILDISDRKRAEEEVRESERRFRRLVESNMFGVAFGDFSGGIGYVNDYFLNMVGYSRSEFNAGEIRWTDITPPEQLYLDERAVIELRTQGVAVPFEKEYIRKDGSRVPILIGAALLQEPYDQQQEMIAFYIDLTERKQAEAERETLLQQTEAARKAAEAANRTRDEFLAVLSHELRTPLNPILGWAKLLQSGKLDESRTKQALATIERNAELQARLIEDLLDISRILQGKLNLTTSPVDLASTVRAAMETVHLAADAKAIRIEAQLAPQVGLVSGDSTRLQQIVWNLLSNAVKFTPAGGRVEVQLAQIGNQAQITVRDTGKGISANFLPYVFDYFRQADSTTTRQFGGLGLGLAIVRHLVELHGGTIRADSPGEGLGATFTVNLPLMASPEIVNLSPQRCQECLDLKNVQILVVDDEMDTRDFIQYCLEQTGAIVRVSASAREALTQLMQFKPDVVLSDIGMPDIDGYTLMQQIRALPIDQGGQIIAIALTAYAGEYDQEQALQVGFQRHLAKPVEPEELIRTIADLVENR